MDFDQITQETLEQVKKAQTSGVLNTTGLFGYNLSQWISLVPVDSPFRNSVRRVPASQGAKFAIWRALLNANASQADPAVGFDYAGNLVVTNEQDMQALFAEYSVAGRVTRSAVALAKGYADARAIETVNVLNQLMIQEDKKMICAQNFALATPGTIVLSTGAPSNGIGPSGSTTTGSITSGTVVHVKVAARTGNNYFYGGSGIASADQTVTVGSVTNTNSVGAYVPAVKGAVAYDWFVGTSNSNHTYATTTTTNTVLLTAQPSTTPASLPTLFMLSTVAPTTPPTADGTAKANDYNGLIASILGDYNSAGQQVTPLSATSWGAYWASNDGAALTLSGGTIPAIETMFQGIYNTQQVSPTALMVNSYQAAEISQLILSSTAAPIFLMPADVTDRTNAVAGSYIGRIVNQAAGGKVIPIEVHPHVPPGTIIARTDTLPYPGSNVSETCILQTLDDYTDFSYGANYNPGVAGGGPREDFQVTVSAAFTNLAPTSMGVLSNVA